MERFAEIAEIENSKVVKNAGIMIGKCCGIPNQIKCNLRIQLKSVNLLLVITSYSIHYTKLYEVRQ